MWWQLCGGAVLALLALWLVAVATGGCDEADGTEVSEVRTPESRLLTIGSCSA